MFSHYIVNIKLILIIGPIFVNHDFLISLIGFILLRVIPYQIITFTMKPIRLDLSFYLKKKYKLCPSIINEEIHNFSNLKQVIFKTWLFQ